MAFMSVVSDLSTLIGFGESIASIFGFGGSSGALSAADIAILQNMLDNLLSEIKQVFLYDLTLTAVRTAAGVATSAHEFLAINYADAQGAGESSAELWTLLTTDTATTRLADLSAQADIMQSLTTTDPQTADQTIGLAIMIYTLMAAFYRERHNNAPDPQTASCYVGQAAALEARPHW